MTLEMLVGCCCEEGVHKLCLLCELGSRGDLRKALIEPMIAMEMTWQIRIRISGHSFRSQLLALSSAGPTSLQQGCQERQRGAHSRLRTETHRPRARKGTGVRGKDIQSFYILRQ